MLTDGYGCGSYGYDHGCGYGDGGDTGTTDGGGGRCDYFESINPHMGGGDGSLAPFGDGYGGGDGQGLWADAAVVLLNPVTDPDDLTAVLIYVQLME